MIPHTQPSLIFDTTILNNGNIQIPDLKKWKNQEVQVIIVFKEKGLSIQEKENKSLSGALKKYANPELIDRETDIAWSNLNDNK
jgi:hypothetical protein